jgi:hypothetical protein
VTQAAPDVGRRPLAVTAAAEVRVCLDCGSVLAGRYCSVCGQRDEPLRRGLKDLALEFVQHPLIDTKLWRSLVPLLLRPGALTVEYLAGRRTRYVRPLKLYLTISVSFFALQAVVAPRAEYVHFDNTPTPGASKVEQKSKDRFHLPIAWLDERFQRNLTTLESPEAPTLEQSINQKFSSMLPKMVFVLLPFSAVLFKLFWWRRYYVEHLVFTLHLHAYAFAAAMLLFLKWPPVTGVVVIWSTVYMALAFKRVYRNGWVKTLAKLAAVALLYSVLVALLAGVTAFATVLAV